MELAIAALLRAVIPEHGTEQIQPRGLRALVETAFEISADDTCGGLGSERKVAAAGVLADPFDELDTLDDRGDHLLVSEPCRHLGCSALGGAPQRAIARKDVANAADGLDRLGARHGCRLYEDPRAHRPWRQSEASHVGEFVW